MTMRRSAVCACFVLFTACTPTAPASAPTCPPTPQAETTKATATAPPVAESARALDIELALFGFLVGQWESESPNNSVPAVAFEPQAQGHALVRRTTSQVPQGDYEDLLTIYVTRQGDVRALLVSNKGGSVEYAVTATDNPRTVVLVSNEIPGEGRRKLTYEQLANGSIRVHFQNAPLGRSEFSGYLEWTMKKK